MPQAIESPVNLKETSKSESPSLVNTISRANELVRAFGAYLVLMVAVLVGYEQLKNKSGITDARILGAIIAIPICAVFFFNTLPAWIKRRRTNILEALGISGTISDPGYFRLTPYEKTDQAFDRADKAHIRVLKWISETTATVLYLTGSSGVGKSSLLQAFVLPRLRNQQPPFHVLECRAFSDPLHAIRTALLQSFPIFINPPFRNDARELLETAAHHLAPQPFLLILDQFEEFIILGTEQHRHEFENFLQSLASAPITGLKLLLVGRSDYLGPLGEMQIPNLQQHVNWQEVAAFTERDAIQFLDNSGLQLSSFMKNRIIEELREIEQASGLVRPITINLIGMILKRFPERLPESYRTGSMLRTYVKNIINRPQIRSYAPGIVARMLTDAGTKQAKSVDEIAREINISGSVVRGVLINLGDEGFVRELNPATRTWEVSHDFIARLLNYVLLGWRARLSEKLRVWTGPGIAMGWLCAILLLLPIYISNTELAARHDLESLDISLVPVTSNTMGARAGVFTDDRTLTEAVPALKRLPNLVEIIITDPLVKNISPLKDLTTLKILQLSGTTVSDLSPIHDMRNLDQLELAFTQVSDITSLIGLRQLRSLNLRGTRVVDFFPLSQLDNLESLNVSLTGIADLSPLKRLTKLRYLDFSGTRVTDISALKDATSMKNLTASETAITGWPALSSMRNLEILSLKGTNISDVSALRDLRQLFLLDLQGTRVTDISALRGLQNLSHLDVSGTKISDFSSLYQLPNLKTLNISHSNLPSSIIVKLQHAMPKVMIYVDGKLISRPNSGKEKAE